MNIFFNLSIVPFILFLLSLRSKYVNSNMLSINSVILLISSLTGAAYSFRGDNFFEIVTPRSAYIYSLFFIIFYLGSLLSPNKYNSKKNNSPKTYEVITPFLSKYNNFRFLKLLIGISFLSRFLQLIININRYGFSLDMGVQFRKLITFDLAFVSGGAGSIWYSLCSIINQNLFYIILTIVTILFFSEEIQIKGKRYFYYLYLINGLLGDFIVGGAYYTFLHFLSLFTVLLLLRGQLIITYIRQIFISSKISKTLLKIIFSILIVISILVLLISIRTQTPFFSVFSTLKNIITYYYAGNLISFSVIQEALQNGENLLFQNKVCENLGLSCAIVDFLPLKFFFGPFYKVFFFLTDQTYFSNNWIITIDNIAPFNTTHFLSFFLSDFGYFFTFVFALLFGFYVKKISNTYYKNKDILSILKISFVCIISIFSIRTWFVDSFSFVISLIFIFLILPSTAYKKVV